MKLTTTDRSQKNIKEHIPSHTSQLWVLVRFLLRAIVSNSCDSLDWLWNCCKPRGVATVFGLLSAGFTVVSKRLERKVTKHEKIYTLALAKLNSVAELVSKALTDKKITDSEFSIILRKVQKYHELKAAIRDGVKNKTIENKETQTQNA